MDKPMTKMKRAELILAQVRATDPTLGKWEIVKKGSKEVPVWSVTTPNWSALFDFEGVTAAEAAAGSPSLEFGSRAVGFDLWTLDDHRKKLSLRWDPSTRAMKLISMQPGPWEALFDSTV